MARQTISKRRKGAARSRQTRRAKAAVAIDASALTKGEIRKLDALRSSLGEGAADRAFVQWLRRKAGAKAAPRADSDAEAIVGALEPLAKAGKLRIPRGGYLVRRGRGRVIVTRAKGD